MQLSATSGPSTKRILREFAPFNDFDPLNAR